MNEIKQLESKMAKDEIVLSVASQSHAAQLEEIRQLKSDTEKNKGLKRELEFLKKRTIAKLASLYHSLEEAVSSQKEVDKKQSLHALSNSKKRKLPG